MGARGPKRFSSAQLKLSGSHRADKRAEEELAVTPGDPTPPAWLSKEAKAEWERVVPVLVKLGIITEQDRALLTIHCQAWGDYESNIKKVRDIDSGKRKFFGHMVDHPRVVMSRAIERMMATADRFGLSSSARTKLGKGEVKPNGNGNTSSAKTEKARFFPEGPAIKTG